MTNNPNNTPGGDLPGDGQPNPWAEGGAPQNPYGTDATYGTQNDQTIGNPYGSAPTDPYGSAPSDPYAQQGGYPTADQGAGYAAAPAFGTAPGYGTAQGYATQPGYGAPQLSSWFRRVLANIIDSIPAIILSGIGEYFGPPMDPTTGEYGDGGSIPIMAAFMLAALAFQLWNRWLRAGKTGQSIGKSAMGMKLVNENTGQPIGALNAFLRDIVHFLDNICLIGYLWPLWDAKRQTFADKIMKTVVIDSK